MFIKVFDCEINVNYVINTTFNPVSSLLSNVQGSPYVKLLGDSYYKNFMSVSEINDIKYVKGYIIINNVYAISSKDDATIEILEEFCGFKNKELFSTILGKEVD